MKLCSVIADYIAFRQSIGQTFRRRYLLFAFNRAVGAEIVNVRSATPGKIFRHVKLCAHQRTS